MNNFINVGKLTKEYTRQEFNDKLEKSKGVLRVDDNNIYACPDHVGLKTLDCEIFSCIECWVNASKDCKFQNE